jgi:hypothetical protein
MARKNITPRDEQQLLGEITAKSAVLTTQLVKHISTQDIVNAGRLGAQMVWRLPEATANALDGVTSAMLNGRALSPSAAFGQAMVARHAVMNEGHDIDRLPASVLEALGRVASAAGGIIATTGLLPESHVALTMLDYLAKPANFGTFASSPRADRVADLLTSGTVPPTTALAFIVANPHYVSSAPAKQEKMAAPIAGRLSYPVIFTMTEELAFNPAAPQKAQDFVARLRGAHTLP